ncbi:putative ribonuclease H-like domain-containing protein [Tanacetum coccineum]
MLVKDNSCKRIATKHFGKIQTCVACLKGKQHRASCKSKVLNPITKPLFMLHMDLFGLTFVSSLMHKKYCLVVTDDYSRFTWVFFLASKDETSEILKNFIKEIENLVDKKVKIIRSDNGTEFKNKVMDDFCREKGIKREYSVARTPQQNGVAERRNRTLIEAARTMLADSKLPTTFWAEAVSTACYVQNRVLVVKPHNKTPYELFRGFKPALSFMRPFGCHVTILNTLDSLGKFDGKSDEGFFVGYSLSSKAFRVYNTRTRRVEETWKYGFLEELSHMIEKNGTITNESSDASYFDSPSKDVDNGEPKSAADDQKQIEDGLDNENDEKDKYEDDSINTASSKDQDSPKDMFKMGASHTLEATPVEFFNEPLMCIAKALLMHLGWKQCRKNSVFQICRTKLQGVQGNLWVLLLSTEAWTMLVTLSLALQTTELLISIALFFDCCFLLCAGFERLIKIVSGLSGSMENLLSFYRCEEANMWFATSTSEAEYWLLLVVVDKYSGFKTNCWIMDLLTKDFVKDCIDVGYPLVLHVKRDRNTKIPQSSGPSIKVGDEAVHKELGDRMEKAATTASNLEAE